MTITALKQKFKSRLSELFPNTEIDSFFSILLEEFTGLRRIDLALNPDLSLSEHQEQQFLEALERLEKKEPIQYILGKTEFCGLSFSVNQQVLIPRPETAELVEWIVNDWQEQLSADFSLLDIGTGSGCIPISLKHRLPQADIWSFDVSAEALTVAKQNAQTLNLPVHFEQVDILQAQSIAQQFDVIVSNPPYVRQLEKAEMQANVLDYEPHLALFVEDNDPLIFYRAILKFTQTHLKTGGVVYFEINEYLQEDMRQLVREFAAQKVQFKTDVFGKARMMKIKF